MKKWIIEVEMQAEKRVVFVIVGNKADLQSEKIIDEQIAQEFAEKIDIKHFFTSAKDGIGIKEVFAYILDGINFNSNIIMWKNCMENEKYEYFSKSI